MTWETFLDIFLDALKDSLLVLAFVFLFHVILSFIEEAISNFLLKRKRTAPLFGAVFGLIPQCGTSVLGADLLAKGYITVGTLAAIFLSCSDEALIVLLSSPNERTWTVLPLLGLKLAIGALSGFMIDSILRKKKESDADKVELDHDCHEHHHEKTPIHEHLVHPLLHSLKIFVYVFAINLALGVLIGFVGEEAFLGFLSGSKYLAPLFATIVGLIPNCASSVLLCELYIGGGLSFGALLGGLLVNSGLGILVLFRNKKTFKSAIFLLILCFAIALASSYIACLVSGF